MLKSLCMGDFMFSGLPTVVAAAAVASFAYLAGLMSKLDETSAEQVRQLDDAWCEDHELAEMTDELFAVTRRAFSDSHGLSRTARSE